MSTTFDPIKGQAQAEMLVSKGIALAEKGFRTEAQIHFEDALQLDPTSADAYDNLATVLAEKGHLFGALDGYLRAIQLDPESPTSHFNLGCFLTHHAEKLSEIQFKKASELDDEFADAHVNVGIGHVEKGEFPEAAQAFSQVLEIDPDDRDSRIELARTYLELGDTRRALANFKILWQKNAEDPDALVGISACYVNHGLLDEAAEVLASGPKNNARILFAQSSILDLKGLLPSALRLLRKAHQLDANYVKETLQEGEDFISIRLQPGFERVLG